MIVGEIFGQGSLGKKIKFFERLAQNKFLMIMTK